MAQNLKAPDILTDAEMFGSDAPETLTDAEMNGEKLNVPLKEKTSLGKVSQYLSEEGSGTLPQMVGSLINPSPFLPSMNNPVPNIPEEFEKKRKLASQAGEKARNILSSGVGKAVTDTSELATKYLPKAISDVLVPVIGVGGGITQSELALSPMTPEQHASIIAPEMMASSIGRETRGIQEGIANRNLQAPKSIAESRLEKGKPRVGEVALDMDKKIADLAIGDKNKIYQRSKDAIGILNGKIKDSIMNFFKKGVLETPEQNVPINQNLSAGEIKPKFGIKTQEIADAMDDTISSVARSDGTDSAAYKSLISYKERFIKRMGEYMNFLKANDERVLLGKDINRSFTKDPNLTSDLIDAQRDIWSALRNKIGEISPEIDEMLSLQHELLDIKASAKPIASKGITLTPSTFVDAVKTPFRSMKIADMLGNRIPELGKNIGPIVGEGVVGSSQANPKDIGEMIGEYIEKRKGNK